MNINDYTCVKCAFCKQSLIPDLTQEYIPGRRRRRIDGLVCSIRPPVTAGGCPIVEPSHGCALWTDNDGQQPLRYLLGHNDLNPVKDEWSETK